jgi:hypothetical protein
VPAGALPGEEAKADEHRGVLALDNGRCCHEFCGNVVLLAAGEVSSRQSFRRAETSSLHQIVALKADRFV